MAKDSPSQMQPKVQIRMEEAFRQKLMDAAYKADRSLNAEIMARLEKSFEDDRAANELAERVSEHDGFLDDHANQLRELWVHIETIQAYVLHMRDEDPVKGTQT